MIKKILITSYIVLATSLTVQGADRWTGPTSPIDPMWGMKGSSIMAEALRDNPQPNTQTDPYYMVDQLYKEKEIKNLKREIDRLKSERGEW